MFDLFNLKTSSALGCSSLRCSSLGCSGLLAVGLLALPALAGSPRAVSLVPDDAEVVVVIPSVADVLTDLDAINMILGEMGADVDMEVTMMTSMLRGMPGIDIEGSAAVVLDMDDDWEGEPDAVILLPVSDFGALTQGREAVDGLVGLDMGGENIYFRDLGNGFAAVSNVSGMVSGFEPGDHSESEIASALGAAGMRVLGSNDVMMYVNLDSLRPMMEESFAEMESQGDMLEMMVGPEAAQAFDAFMNVYKTAVKDGQAVLGGLNFDAERGISFDFGLQFSEGSESAAYFQNEGDAGAYFDRVPDMDFYYAQAFDLRGEGIQKMMSGYLDMIEGFDTTGMVSGMNLGEIMKEFQGGAQVMGATNVMAMNGILANTVMYTEGVNADECIDSLKGIYGSMSEMEMPGMGISASFSDEPETVNGVEAYSHSMSFEIDPAMGGGGFGAPDPAMMLQMMYGPSRGPAGYIAKAGDGMVMTFSQDGDLLERAYKAANGQGTMMGNSGIAAAAAMLPENRVMEMYVGAGQIMNTAGPMLMMFGVIPEFEPMEGVTPLAFGMTADGGGMLFRTVLPMNTIEAVVEMIPAEAMGGGGHDDDWDEDDDDDMQF